MIHNNTCFGAYLYSVGIQHGNLHQLSVTTSRVTSHRNLHQPQLTQEKLWERVWGKNEGEWPGKVRIHEGRNPEQ